MRNLRIASMILVVLAVCAPRAARAGEKILKSVPVGKDGIQLQLVCGGKKGKANLSVAAIGKDAPAVKLVLERDSMCLGNERFDVEYAAREFKLSPALTGALFEEAVYEDFAAHHSWLIAIVDGKLHKLWHAMFSTQEVVSDEDYSLKIVDRDGNGRQEIDYTAPFPISNNTEHVEEALKANEAGTDSWDHRRLEFDEAKKAMVKKLPHEEYAAVLASTKTVSEALTLKLSLLKNPKCAAEDFLVLETETLPKLRKGFFVVAGISDSRAEAEAKLARIKSCRPEISGTVRQVR